MKEAVAHKGFSIVELLVAVAIIAILATITIFALGSWRQRVAVTEVKNELTAAATALKDYKIFGSGYPIGSPPSLPATYKATPNVTIVYISGTASTYCLRGTSVAVSSVVFYMSHSLTTPQTTACT
ncbi:prepilin-type N-terminal cleavage/methylation domain-containing protein [Candidatus Saccharibacteria bacterium]|nr:prepilin-type N-terminal cleavage/methylation domain-containing protein [Candidatus Saccharibacteria bacterium]